MKRVLFYFSVFCSLLFIRCDGPISDMSEKNSNEVIIADVYVDDKGFLVFSSQSVYQESSSLIDSMTDQEFLNWEQQIGFLSAQTFLNNAEKEMSMIENLVQYDNFKNKYSGKLIFTEEGDVNLPFYATAWSRVLSPEGIMKIGDVLYRFDKEKQITIIGGQYEDAMKTYENSVDTSVVRLFYPNRNHNNDNYKSTTIQLIKENIYSRDGKSKLEYELQVINFYYCGYGSTGSQITDLLLYTQAGYEVRFKMLQKRKNILGIWYKNETKYYIKDINFSSRHRELVQPMRVPQGNGQYLILYTQGDIYNNISVAYLESSETNNGANARFFYYQNSIEGRHPQIDFEICDFDITFWSRGFETDEAITISNFSRLF